MVIPASYAAVVDGLFGLGACRSRWLHHRRASSASSRCAIVTYFSSMPVIWSFKPLSDEFVIINLLVVDAVYAVEPQLNVGDFGGEGVLTAA